MNQLKQTLSYQWHLVKSTENYSPSSICKILTAQTSWLMFRDGLIHLSIKAYNNNMNINKLSLKYNKEGKKAEIPENNCILD